MFNSGAAYFLFSKIRTMSLASNTNEIAMVISNNIIQVAITAHNPVRLEDLSVLLLSQSSALRWQLLIIAFGVNLNTS